MAAAVLKPGEAPGDSKKEEGGISFAGGLKKFGRGAAAIESIN